MSDADRRALADELERRFSSDDYTLAQLAMFTEATLPTILAALRATAPVPGGGASETDGRALRDGLSSDDQAAARPAPAGFDPSRCRQRRDEDEFSCEYDSSFLPDADDYTILWDSGARWLMVKRNGNITIGRSPGNQRLCVTTTWEELFESRALSATASATEAEGGDAVGGSVHEGATRRETPGSDPLDPPRPSGPADHEQVGA